MTVMIDQGGQALAEALVVLAALAGLCLGIAWLGRTQDAALQLSHASRQAAFAWALQDLPAVDLSSQAKADSLAPGQRGRTRSGAALLPDGMHVRLDALPGWQGRRPGDPVPGAADIRRELELGDETLWRLRAHARTAGQDRTLGDLRDFDDQALFLQRHTAIMRGAGAAADDAAVQGALGGSGQVWGQAWQAAQAAGSDVDRRLQGVDAAWGRERPRWDWLGPWTGRVPERHLQRRSAP
ncbi:hypothetical protein [Castellaniella sp.]|uniref:hypothetical protein n=1 Tax=Castellaniella sp. TaxID=1955812 RepID=UPI003C71EDF5